jgi:hypothetical protein
VLQGTVLVFEADGFGGFEFQFIAIYVYYIFYSVQPNDDAIVVFANDFKLARFRWKFGWDWRLLPVVRWQKV